VEVLSFAVAQRRVVTEDDWAAAAEVVREGFEEGDAITVAPRWADPLLRQHLGDLIDPAMAGRSDLEGYRRLWTLSIRGHRPVDAPPVDAAVDVLVGRVRVLRWPLPAPTVLYDFVEHVADARVEWVEGGEARPCHWDARGRPQGGGLGAGPLTPGQLHRCDPRRPWLWVGATTQDTLDLEPRRCLWQHPPGPEPLRATFTDVPLGDRVVLYGGIYYEHERHEEHGPVSAEVFVDGASLGALTREDGDGWVRFEASTRLPGRTSDRGTVVVEVTAPDPNLRTFCWAGSTRTGAVE
jgi:hypothetical protein